MPTFRQSAIVLASALLLPGLLPSCDCGNDDTDDGTVKAWEDPYPDSDRGEWLTMAALPDGSPVAAFYNRTKQAAEYAIPDLTTDPVTWRYEEIDGFADDQGMNTGNRGQYISMAVAPDGTVWVAYYDADNGNLRYGRRTIHANLGLNGEQTEPTYSTWMNDLADVGGGSQQDAGKWVSMALDATGNPVVAHYDAAKKELRVAHWLGAGFSGEVVDAGEDYVDGETTIEADVGQYTRIEIDLETGTEYIAYYDAAWGRLQLAIGTAGAYQITTVDDDGDVGQWPSIYLADDGKLHLAYQDVGNQDLLYASGTPGYFTPTVVDDGEFAGADSEIFLFGDYMAIAYFSGRENDLRLAKFNGTGWSLETLAGDDAALGFHNEVLTTGGRFYIGCYDYTNRAVWFDSLE